MSQKTERGIATRQAILNHLNRGGPYSLAELALKLREPRKVVLGHLNLMVAAGEVAKWPEVYVAKARKTKAFVHGGAVKNPPKRTVNLCANKAAIKNQGGQGQAAPRQTVHKRIFGL